MAQAEMKLQDYARETYSRYKADGNFHVIICTLAHAYRVRDPSLLTKTVNECSQTEHKKISAKTTESFLDDFAEEGLVMLGIDKNMIIHQPTKLSQLVLKLYASDPDVGKRHKLPNF